MRAIAKEDNIMIYPEPEDVTTTVEMTTINKDLIRLDFSCDGGKFGTEESLAEFSITPEKLLEILNKNYDY